MQTPVSLLGAVASVASPPAREQSQPHGPGAVPLPDQAAALSQRPERPRLPIPRSSQLDGAPGAHAAPSWTELWVPTWHLPLQQTLPRPLSLPPRPTPNPCHKLCFWGNQTRQLDPPLRKIARAVPWAVLGWESGSLVTAEMTGPRVPVPGPPPPPVKHQDPPPSWEFRNPVSSAHLHGRPRKPNTSTSYHLCLDHTAARWVLLLPAQTLPRLHFAQNKINSLPPSCRDLRDLCPPHGSPRVPPTPCCPQLTSPWLCVQASSPAPASSISAPRPLPSQRPPSHGDHS